MKNPLVVVAVALLSCCSQPTAPTPAQPTSTSSQTNATCSAQGTGNTVYCVPASPSPTPATPKCTKAEPEYQENMVRALASIPSGQTLETLFVALQAALTKAGFKSWRGGTLSSDEIAVKIDGFSETYDFYRADGTPQVLYLLTCTPPLF